MTLFHNTLTISGPDREVDRIATAFMWGKPFADLVPLTTSENPRHDALLAQRRRLWGTPDEAIKPNLLDVMTCSASIEFITVESEPDAFLASIARQHPAITGTCQFYLQGHPHIRSGIVRISGGKTFARTYTKQKEYA